ncbi:MAG: hypothetical protein KBB01_05770 [Candidatus Omnitrophica bacterium]|nr:hypothetical protein [Candidatus Omnitrophota bacterium]
MVKKTEDQVIKDVMYWLKQQGWTILSFSLGQQRGLDILAEKNGKKLIVEAKGAKGNAKNTKRNKFDSGQIKIHFGAAIIKILEERTKNPKASFAIALPEDKYMKGVLKNVRPQMDILGIKLMWVKSKSEIVEEKLA